MNAVAHGIPVVTTEPKVDGVVDVAGHEVVFIPRGDVEALVQELASLRNDGAKRDSLAIGSLAVAERHSWSEIARRTREVYGL
jgi:glycosyltransferase involved in cell wall biosynthesis